MDLDQAQRADSLDLVVARRRAASDRHPSLPVHPVAVRAAPAVARAHQRLTGLAV
jgi:hypothetical protein